MRYQPHDIIWLISHGCFFIPSSLYRIYCKAIIIIQNQICPPFITYIVVYTVVRTKLKLYLGSGHTKAHSLTLQLRARLDCLKKHEMSAT